MFICAVNGNDMEAVAKSYGWLKVNDAVIVSLDTESRQIVIAPKNQEGIQEQYFAKASVVAKPAKAEDRW